MEETTRKEIVAYLTDLDRTPPLSWDDPGMHDENGPRMMDVRLQIHDDGSWSIHTGDSQYDQDHRGSLGSTVIPFEGDPEGRDYDPDEIAEDLIDQCEESAAQGDDSPDGQTYDQALWNSLTPGGGR